jgi:8-oxo-dGTP pyrophosphatase MutT (NUDIX family)
MLYPSAKAIVYDPARPEMFLLVKRNGYYEPAGGKLHVNFAKKKAETLEQCAIREASEELGAHISIKDYLGNYYFFWTIDTNSMSSCVVFSAQLLSTDESFMRNLDCDEFPIAPAWIHAQDILNGNALIDRYFVGLEDIMKKFAEKQLSI